LVSFFLNEFPVYLAMTLEQFPELPPLPETPLEAVKKITCEQVIMEGQTFLIAHPAESDRLLEHPALRSAFAADEYLPYWADLWPAARMLGKAILRETWTPGLEALEIGCGLGLPGIVALSRGLRVIFSDYDVTALRFAADNARLNGFEDFQTRPIDWRSPPTDLQVPVVLAADLLYELRNVEPLVLLIKKVLAPEGLCLLTDQDRVPSLALRERLTANGLMFTTRVMHASEPGGRRTKGTLYRIKNRPA
jgi:predicted nicotinamide N-methyase